MARIIMGMPVSVDIIGTPTPEIFEKIFGYFTWVDETFSTYKKESEISRINSGELKLKDASEKVQKVFKLCEETKEITNGAFDIYKKDGTCDPSGLVKGWAIYQASFLLKAEGYENFFIEAGGDIQVSGHNEDKGPWRVGIRDPFKKDSLLKIVALANGEGIATSGTYERGQHIYDPRTGKAVTDLVALTVIGKNCYEADRFATAAFVMGNKALSFIQSRSELEAVVTHVGGKEEMTAGFNKYIVK